MRAIQVTKWGESPKLTTNARTPAEPSSDDEVQIKVLASGLPQLVRSQALGVHYSVRDAVLPYIPGMDGVGFTTRENKLVYFMATSGGAMAEYVTVPKHAVFPLSVSNDMSDDKKRILGIKIAALINPAMSSWMALQARANVDKEYEKGQYNVLILGVTSTSGRIAATLARKLGAAKIMGAARDVAQLEAFKAAELIDFAIPINKEDPTKTDLELFGKERVHVVLDYIWGPTALAFMGALPSSASKAEDLAVQWVHVGSVGKVLEVALPGALLRSKNISLTGSGPGSWSLKRLARELPALLEQIQQSLSDEYAKDFGVIERKLDDADTVWDNKEGRTVFVL